MGARSNLLFLSLAIAMAGCASPPPTPVAMPPGATPAAPSAIPRYRCDNSIAFTVRFGDGTADIDAGPQGEHSLLRDAGGLTPQQTVYSSTKLKAEFGLEPEGRGARLSYVSPALEARCLKE